MPKNKFSAAVAEWARKNERVMSAIVKQSTQEVVSIAQTVIGDGGKLPIDTGFLRQSFSISLASMPSGPSQPPAGATAFTYDQGQVELTINGVKLGDTIYGGWTAAYAMRLEYGFNGTDSLGRSYSQSPMGFLRSAAQQWPRIVSEVAERAKGIK